MAIYVKELDDDEYMDTLSGRLGEDVASLFKAEVMGNHRITKRWFVLMMSKASFDWGNGIIGNTDFAEALYEYLEKNFARITDFICFLDEVGEEVEWGRGVQDMLHRYDEQLPECDEQEAMNIARQRFKNVYYANNGITIGFHRSLSDVKF